MKYDGQVRVALSADNVLSTIVAMLFGTNLGVALQCACLRNHVSRFTAVDERLAAIRIKAKYFYIRLICAHAPTEYKDDTTKDAFYDKLRCPKSDMIL